MSRYRRRRNDKKAKRSGKKIQPDNGLDDVAAPIEVGVAADAAHDYKASKNQRTRIASFQKKRRRTPSIWQTRNAIIFVTFILTFFDSSSCSFAIATVENEIFYVIEPFDSISDQWFTRVYNDQGKLNLTVSTSSEEKEVELPELNDLTLQAPLFGNGALRVEYQVVHTEDWGGFVDFGWILNSTGVAHNCYGATHLSLWYKILETQSLPGRVHLRLIMMDDSDCTLEEYKCADPPGQNLENYYSFHYVLDDNHGTDNIFDATNSATNDSEWQELRLELLGDESSESPFWRTG